MIWSEGFSASYYITIVDPLTWRDIARKEITGGAIEHSSSDLMESADIDMTEAPSGGETWVRIWLDAAQSGTEHIPLFTGLASAPARDIDGRRESYKVECYSVLKPADDVLTDRGYYIPAEIPAVDAAARLLRIGPAPVEVSDATQPRLVESIVAEDGETNLSLAQKVLDSVNWRLRIDGRGVIHLEERSSDTVAVFDASGNDIIEPELTDEQDLFSCPNVFRAISDDQTAIARDDSPESPLSTYSRGREIWAEESSVKLNDKESLAAYANRRLAEMQAPARTVKYTRRYYPGISVGDRVIINHPEIGINGVFQVSSQSFDLSYGCRTQEEATEV